MIDFAIVSVPLYVIVSLLMRLFFGNLTAGPVYPFVLLGLVYFPYGIIAYLVQYPAASDILMVALSAGMLLILETSAYTVMETLNDGRTIGKKLLGITVVSDEYTEYTLIAKIFRNTLKILSRCILFIPMAPMLLTEKKQTAYDLFIGTVVV